jgi:hypothetical protein
MIASRLFFRSLRRRASHWRLHPVSTVLILGSTEGYVIRTGGFIAMFDCRSNVGLEFALGGDMAVGRQCKGCYWL